MMDRADIENQARLLQFEIWHHRRTLFPLGIPPVTALFQPEVAARVLDLRYEDCDGTRLAGLMDRPRRLVAVSMRLASPSRRFVGSHLVGRYLLHPDPVVHRDRAIADGVREVEGDCFASSFLAPQPTVRDEFGARFVGRGPLRLDDAVAWSLLGQSADEIFTSDRRPLDFAVAVAGATKFNGRRFRSLSEHFGLSNHAMATRLQELELVAS